MIEYPVDVEVITEADTAALPEYAALLAHCTDCPTCLDGCETGAQLRRAVREARR